jgi:hypothetical protein
MPIPAGMRVQSFGKWSNVWHLPQYLGNRVDIIFSVFLCASRVTGAG